MDHIRRVFLQKCSSAWLVLLILAIVSYTKDVTATTSSECLDGGTSDGRCDFTNNNVNCDYDGGDCCECTCVDSTYTCGPSYICLDPSVECDGDNHGNINNHKTSNHHQNNNGPGNNDDEDSSNDGSSNSGGDDSSNNDGASSERGDPSGESDSSGDDGYLNGVIGASVGALVVVIVIAAVYCCCYKRERNASAPTAAAAPTRAAAPTEAAAPIIYALAKPVDLETPVKVIHAQPPPSAPYQKEFE